MHHQPFQVPQNILTAWSAFVGKTQGQVFYTGSDGLPKALATSTALRYLATGGSGANPSWEAGLRRLNYTDCGGSAVTSFSTPTLDFSPYLFVFFVFTLRNTSTVTANSISVYFSGDTTAANYYRQSFAAVGGASGAGSGNNSALINLSITGGIKESTNVYGFFSQDMDNKTRIFTTSCENSAANTSLRFGFVHRATTTGTPTSVTLSGSLANGIEPLSNMHFWGGVL